MKKLNNDIVDQRLYDRNIKRIDDYIDKETKIRFQCLIEGCGHIWMAKPGNIFSGKGCPGCVGLIRLSNEIVDQRLLNRNIIRLENIINNKIKTNFQCLICDHIWKTSADSILNQNTGCPNCQRLSEKDIDIFLQNKNIRRLDPYITGSTPIMFQCLFDHCNYRWITAPKHILYDGTECPKCAGILTLNNEIVDQRLVGRNIKRLGNYINNYTKIKFQCLKNNCNHIWETRPNSILSRETGCPSCSFGKNETIVYNILKDTNIEIERFKYLKNIIEATKNLIVDFYIPNNKVIIEYNGEQHYRPVCFGGCSPEIAQTNFEKQKDRDLYLQKVCDENNIKLIWIDGRKYFNSKLEKYVLDFLIPEINGDVK